MVHQCENDIGIFESNLLVVTAMLTLKSRGSVQDGSSRQTNRQ